MFNDINEFLKSSTIHGLAYIGGSKSRLEKIGWTVIVLISFVISGVLIGESFTTWSDSPMITSIETFEISKISFPSITVCPPKGTKTSLNLDLRKLRNRSLNEDEKAMFVELVDAWIFEKDPLELVEEIKAFTAGHLMNYYLGITSLSLPYDGTVGTVANLFTITSTSSNGYFSVPGFDKPLPGLGFRRNINYKYFIELPSNLPDVLQNGSLVIILTLDLKKSEGGWDKLRLSPVKKRPYSYQQKKLSNYTKEFFINKKFIDFRSFSFGFLYTRHISQEEYDLWENKRMTGFTVQWYLKNKGGAMHKTESPSKFERQNEDFIRMANFVFEESQKSSPDLESAWQLVKNVKRRWLKENTKLLCRYGQVEDISYLVRKVAPDVSNLPIYSANMTEELLDEGFKMFVFLAYCPPEESLTRKQFHTEMFSSASVRQILKHLVNIIKYQNSGETLENKLYEELDKIVKFDSLKLEVAMSKSSDLLQQIDGNNPLFSKFNKSWLQMSEHLNVTNMTEMSLLVNDGYHPVHIIDENNKMMSSSFIPFCAIASNMSITGKVIDNFSLPVCNVFKPKIWNGHHCYQLNMKRFSKHIKQGPLGGVQLLLDYNLDRDIRINKQHKKTRKDLVNGFIEKESLEDSNDEAKVIIETLKPFIGNGGGSYKMTAVKDIVGSKVFLKSLENRGECQNEETLSECASKQFIDGGLKKCNCIPLPWIFKSVIIFKKKTLILTFYSIQGG